MLLEHFSRQRQQRQPPEPPKAKVTGKAPPDVPSNWTPTTGRQPAIPKEAPTTAIKPPPVNPRSKLARQSEAKEDPTSLLLRPRSAISWSRARSFDSGRGCWTPTWCRASPSNWRRSRSSLCAGQSWHFFAPPCRVLGKSCSGEPPSFQPVRLGRIRSRGAACFRTRCQGRPIGSRYVQSCCGCQGTGATRGARRRGAQPELRQDQVGQETLPAPKKRQPSTMASWMQLAQAALGLSRRDPACEGMPRPAGLSERLSWRTPRSSLRLSSLLCGKISTACRLPASR